MLSFASWVLLSGCTPPPDPVVSSMPSVALNELSPSNAGVLVDAEGETPDWIEILNSGDAAVDLGGWKLSDDDADPAKWTFPDVSLAPGALLLVLASGDGGMVEGELHASFQLDADGEPVSLYDASGERVDRAEPVAMDPDQSYGRTLDGSGDWGYFLEPTPGAPNTTESRPGYAPDPILDPPAGTYPSGVDVRFSAPAGDVVRIAEDGSEPGDTSEIAPPTLSIAAGGDAVVVRARTFSDDLWPSHTVSATYFPRAAGPMSLVSIITDPPNLWDPDTGIYVYGDSYDSELPYLGANFWEDWEVPAEVAAWEPDGSLAFDVEAGLSIHGGWTRAFAQKSFDVKLDQGDEAIEHQIFPDQPITSFDRILLRDAGNDWHGCFMGGCNTGAHLRDGLVHAIAAGQDVDGMAYRPTEVYLNGEFWGIYEFREKPDDSYLHDHYGDDDVDLLELGVPLEGDTANWDATMSFLRSNDLSDPDNWATVEGMIDVDELATWLATEVFADNTDWPGNNVRWWRPRTDGGKWRWFLYDTDFGLGAYDGSPDHDDLAAALADDGPDWPNPPWATEPFRLLMASPQFVQIFVSRYADLLNTSFAYDNTTAQLAAISGGIATDMPRQVDRWGTWTDGTTTLTMPDSTWDAQVEQIDEWLEDRPTYARQQLVDDLGLAGTYTLELSTNPPGAGSFQLTSATVDWTWSGTYFRGIPVTVTAVPADGRVFVGWSDPSLPQSPTVSVDSLGGDVVSLVAQFE